MWQSISNGRDVNHNIILHAGTNFPWRRWRVHGIWDCLFAAESNFCIQPVGAVSADFPYMRTVLTFTSADGDARWERRMAVNFSWIPAMKRFKSWKQTNKACLRINFDKTFETIFVDIAALLSIVGISKKLGVYYACIARAFLWSMRNISKSRLNCHEIASKWPVV